MTTELRFSDALVPGEADEAPKVREACHRHVSSRRRAHRRTAQGLGSPAPLLKIP